MSFHRKPSAHVVAHAIGTPAVVARFIGEREIAEVMAATDPFGIADPCEGNPVTGEHVGIGSCGHVVCCYCSRIFWR